ncbi:MAG: hypothetical protein FWG77_07805 [Treponema sp.]|nr:hypothetical protein [Treponema sp.]
MKSMIKAFGIVLLITVIGISMGACASSASPRVTYNSVTITDIPSAFEGKFAMLTLDTGGSGARTLAWGTRTITGSSATFNLLDWVTDRPTTIREGNYGVNLIIAANMTAITNDEEEYVGIIMSRAFFGETVLIEFGELMSF